MAFATTYLLPCGQQHVLDVDADEYGQFIALLDNSVVVTNTQQVGLASCFRYPLIRRLDPERFVIVETQQLGANAHVFDWTGRQLGSLEVGAGIQDVLVQAGRLVVAYFDEGVLSGRWPAADGLSVFEVSGAQVFGYNTSYTPHLLDCYALCRWGKDRVVAYPYPAAPLVELHLETTHLRRLAVPAGFSGVTALSVYRGELIYYVSPYQQASYFGWQQAGRVRRQYVAAGPLRGIDNGWFLAHDTTSFTLFDARQALQLDLG
jgi:hypothetical protein